MVELSLSGVLDNEDLLEIAIEGGSLLFWCGGGAWSTLEVFG